MNIKSRKVVLYGTERLIKDFIYMFPNTKIAGYIVENKNELKTTEKAICTFKQINKKILKFNLLILCMRRNPNIDHRLKRLGIIHRINYCYLDEISFLLNDFNDIAYHILLKLRSKFVKKYKKHIEQYFTNSYLFNWMIYTDSIDGPKCTIPFNYVHVQPDGFAHSCCPGYAYNKIGNLFFKKTKKIWNSNAIKLFRLSIINKTYTFCNRTACPYLNSTIPQTNTRFDDLITCDTPKEVWIGIDRSCNLKCRSCRKDFFNAKGSDLKKANKLSKILVNSEWTSKSKRLILASQGEIFFSNVYKKMLFDSKITQRDSLEILSNGTLMTKNNLDKLTKLYNNLSVFITIDAATEETYKKIRIGGNFNKLMENLEYLSLLRKNNIVKKVTLLFVIQKENYKEVIDVLKLQKKLGFDRTSFSQISNWGTYTYEEFKEISMIKENGMPKKELAKILKHPLVIENSYKHSNISKFINK